jgi:periplasmic protein TonB
VASTGVSLLIFAGIGGFVALSAAAVRSDAVQQKVDVIFRAQPSASSPPPPPPPAPKSKPSRSLTALVPSVIPQKQPEVKPADPTPPAQDSGSSAKDDGGVEGGVVGGVKGGVVGGVLGGTGASKEPINLPENATPPQASADNGQPAYPESARAQGLEGLVILKVVVREDGSVGKVDVMRGDAPFVEAAVAMVKTWHYSPALVAGVPTSVYRIIKVPFRLRS